MPAVALQRPETCQHVQLREISWILRLAISGRQSDDGFDGQSDDGWPYDGHDGPSFASHQPLLHELARPLLFVFMCSSIVLGLWGLWRSILFLETSASRATSIRPGEKGERCVKLLAVLVGHVRQSHDGHGWSDDEPHAGHDGHLVRASLSQHLAPSVCQAGVGRC